METRGRLCFRKAEQREPSANNRLRMVGKWNCNFSITGISVTTALVEGQEGRHMYKKKGSIEGTEERWVIHGSHNMRDWSSTDSTAVSGNRREMTCYSVRD